MQIYEGKKLLDLLYLTATESLRYFGADPILASISALSLIELWKWISTINKQAIPVFMIVTGAVIITMVTVEKEKSEMTLLPGGALVNFLELNPH